MTSTYSSNDFHSQWRFSLKEDFRTDSGESYPYAEDGRKQWGDELHRIPYPECNTDALSYSRTSALSHDGQRIAVSDGSDIVVYSTGSYKLTHRLHGHLDNVGALAFRPDNSNCLVSSSTNRTNGRALGSITYFWDLDNCEPDPLLDANNTSRISLAAVKSAVTEIHTLSSSRLKVTTEEEAALSKQFEPHVARLISEKLVGTKTALQGHLHRSCKSHTFSASGHAMFYMPNGPRRSNRHDGGWKLGVYSPYRNETMFMLVGHTDSIMWTGFNHDETLIGTCGWDRTIRIWNAFDGSEKYKWETEGQNWAGAFSPDGKFFIGTCGQGLVHVYNLGDGNEHMTFDSNKRWCRALAWHPSSSWFAVGGGNGGKLYLIDVHRKESFQTRILGTELSKVTEQKRRYLDHWLELSTLHIVDGGRKIVFRVSADGSADTYDLTKQCKWRFARIGTENAPDNEEPVTSKPGHGMHVWEDHQVNQVRIATMDGDGIRFWALPLTV